MTPEELEASWSALATPDDPRFLEARAAGRDLWTAVDYQGQRHLLVAVPLGAEAPTTETRGLQVTVADHQVRGQEPQTYLDLACLTDQLHATFNAVAADIGEAAAVRPDERATAVTDALRRWQWFWGVDAGQLSDREALGLFGELWFLHRWVADAPEAIEHWNATDNARHDFQWPAMSVEVKTTARRAEGTVTHRIVNLDQLAAPESGDLYLFSLRVVRDELAHNRLPELVDAIQASIEGSASISQMFAEKLSGRGYSPAHRERYATNYRILGEVLYQVEGAFPRLTPDAFLDGVPAGIGDVSYVIDMAACEDWVRARNPSEWPPAQG